MTAAGSGPSSLAESSSASRRLSEELGALATAGALPIWTRSREGVLMREGPRRTSRARWLIALFATALLVCGLAPVRAWAEGEAVYVSADGSDETGDGTQGNPWRTISFALGVENNDGKAENASPVVDGGTVYLLTDVEMGGLSARIYDKSVTIDGNGHSITRSEDMAQRFESVRAYYNPAMFEIGKKDP